MIDLFEQRNIDPMLIAEIKNPFDSEDYIYELKLDGIRCIAYLDRETVDLRNKRHIRMLPWLPELTGINRAVNHRCVLDGEIFVLKNGVTDFWEIQRRSIMTDPFKIQLAAGRYPAAFCAFDIIYYDNHCVTDLPLIKRKALLASEINEETAISISRYIERNGVQLFELAKERHLEGVVAKRKESLYWFGKRSKDWIKFKVLKTADCVVCGYILKPNSMTSIVIGQYDDMDKLVYKGHVTLGSSIRKIGKYEIIHDSPFKIVPAGNENAVWLKPVLACVIEYMPSDKTGYRQAVFKGIRDDKAAKDCRICTDKDIEL